MPPSASLSKNPCFHAVKAGVLLQLVEKYARISRKMESLQLQFASFFRFMAAYFSLTHLVTAAKPLFALAWIWVPSMKSDHSS